MSKRIEWVDAAKGIGIMLVMLGHNWLHWDYCYWIYAFHMPLFFILSGYTLSTCKSFGDFATSRARVLLIPYMVFVVCHMVFYYLMSAIFGGEYNWTYAVVGFIRQQRFTYLWFLPTLFFASLVSYFICKMSALSCSIWGGESY